MNAGRVLSLLCVLAGALLLGVGQVRAQGSSDVVVVGHIDGIINPVMAGYVSRVIDTAEREQAQAVVFYLDTPGGLSDAMRDINQRILRARVPVIVYVAPDGARAGSAGVYISYAANLLGMAPATNIGSATPVAMGENGQEAQMSDEMKNKVTNDAAAGIRALAEQRGRNADWAETAVRNGANLQASEAVKQNVANFVATDLPDLLNQMTGRQVHTAAGDVTLRTAGAPTEDVGMSPIESFLLTITNPTIAYILLSLGSVGLLLELYNPGSVFPGVIGGICLLLAFYALGTLPLNFAGVALILFGLLLFGLEPFLPSHGVLAFGGAVAFIVGSLLLINVPPSEPFLRVSYVAIGVVSAILFSLLALVVTAAVRARRRRAVTGREGLLGASGVARTELRAGTPGLVLTQGELWQAVPDFGTIPVGHRVVVQRVDGLLLTVRPATAGEAAPYAVEPASDPPKTPARDTALV
jgi:membrane-bound serine protease (ClpP class)